MKQRAHRALITIVVLIFALSAFAQSKLDKIKADYQAAASQLRKHLVYDDWLDDAPESAGLLDRQWSLAAEWVAAWLNAHDSTGVNGVNDAIDELVPDEGGDRSCLDLGHDAYLVTSPAVIVNVFIVAKRNGRYRVAWSTAQTQGATGEEAEVLAAWFAENARHGGRGPYYAASGSSGPVIPTLGALPNDAQGRARFYIDGVYAQGAGGTAGAQISLWLWDGTTARPLIARDYTIMIDQRVGTRLEGDLLKVQQKKFFRAFFSCGMCEERQTDWIIRITPEGIEDLGEQSTVPELNIADELFYRVINHTSATDIASPAAIKAAEELVEGAREDSSEEEWKKFPSLGMMMEQRIDDIAGAKILCLSLDSAAGANLFVIKSDGGKPFITGIYETQSCEGPTTTKENR